MEFKGATYCEACAEKLQKGQIQAKEISGDRCAGCGGGLFGGIKRAMGKTWHPLCFVCTTCRQPLDADFKEHNGKPYCDEHYGQFAEHFCAKCGEAIRAGDFVDEGAKKFHIACFTCARCNANLQSLGGKFVKKGGIYHCLPCSKMA